MEQHRFAPGSVEINEGGHADLIHLLCESEGISPKPTGPELIRQVVVGVDDGKCRLAIGVVRTTSAGSGHGKGEEPSVSLMAPDLLLRGSRREQR